MRVRHLCRVVSLMVTLSVVSQVASISFGAVGGASPAAAAVLNQPALPTNCDWCPADPPDRRPTLEEGSALYLGILGIIMFLFP